jgi:hypothetical protein
MNLSVDQIGIIVMNYTNVQLWKPALEHGGKAH